MVSSTSASALGAYIIWECLNTSECYASEGDIYPVRFFFNETLS